jgi:hypothetical protein
MMPRGPSAWREPRLALAFVLAFGMSTLADKKLKAEIAEKRRLRLEAMNLQEIEGNPLDADDIAMFEMFEREGWSDEQRHAHIAGLVRALARK